MNSKKTNEFMNAVGAMAEMSLVFYRATLGAGANVMEATRLTQAYIAAMVYGKGQNASDAEREESK